MQNPKMSPLRSLPSIAGLARLVAVALLSVTTLAGPASAQNCAGEPGSPPPVSLEWLGLPAPDSQTQGSNLTLIAHNSSDESVSMMVDLLIDRGDKRPKRKRFSIPRLEARASDVFVVDLQKFAPRDGMSSSGQVLAVARFAPTNGCTGRDCDPLTRLSSVEVDVDEDGVEDPTATNSEVEESGAQSLSAPLVYFHREAGSDVLEMYGSEVLVSRYHAGALDGFVQDEPDVEVQRVTVGRKGRPDSRVFQAEEDIETAEEEPVSRSADRAGGIKLGQDEYRLCVKWEVQVSEQGRKVELGNGTTITEDYWHGYSTSTGNGVLTLKPGGGASTGVMAVAARGVLVRIKRGDWSEVRFADPKTGCFSFRPPGPGPFELRVYSHHRDKYSNNTIVRGSAGKKLAWQTTVNPPAGKTRAVHVGNYHPNATMAAISGFAMYRTALGNTGKTIEMLPSKTCAEAGGAASSAHVRLDGLEDGIAYVQLHSGIGVGSTDGEPCSTSDHRRAKFLVTHEMGHAWLLLRTKMAEPTVVLTLDDPDETEPACINDGLYTLDSLEYSGVGAREGTAHFYATLVWNNPGSPNAVFSMWGGGRNVESFNGKSGGQIWNQCTTPIKCGKSVNMDWLRFWWDWHTPFGPNKPSAAKIAEVYEHAITNGSFSATNFYQEFKSAMDAVVNDGQQHAKFNLYAHWNGVDTSPAGPQCIPEFTYPACPYLNPQDGAGEPGCPCTDVLPINSNQAQLAASDGYHPDGQGSYLATGSAQYCVDTPGSENVCGRVKILNTDVLAPACEVCGTDTMLGCSCDNDEQCDGFDSENLDCFGAPANGWAGSKPGVCLPSPGTPQGQSRLVDMPWFCLDNCGSKSGGGNDTYVCLYDQLTLDPPLPHGECTDALFCSAPAGLCESLGEFCDADAICSDEECCVPECVTDTDCTDLAFPAFYSCDVGKCVPPECVGNFGGYCNLYR